MIAASNPENAVCIKSPDARRARHRGPAVQCPPVYSLWGVLAAAALLWPDRVSGLLDGVPLDRIPEAVLVAAVLPALWWFHPRFLRTRSAQALILALVVWRALAPSWFAQDGWCVR